MVKLLKLALILAIASFICFFFSTSIGIACSLVGIVISISKIKNRYSKFVLLVNLIAFLLHVSSIVYLFLHFTTID